MDCPVCNSSGISDESKKCPQCDADFEAFQLINKIEQSSKKRLLFGWIATILCFLLLVAFVVFLINTPKADEVQEQDSMELSLLKSDLDKAQKHSEDLLNQNTELKVRLNKKAEESAKQEKVYIVESGETLFIIARKVLGNGYKYTDIAKDNNISNPDIITTGQKLVIYY